jgi:hypothetical protein
VQGLFKRFFAINIFSRYMSNLFYVCFLRWLQILAPNFSIENYLINANGDARTRTGTVERLSNFCTEDFFNATETTAGGGTAP